MSELELLEKIATNLDSIVQGVYMLIVIFTMRLIFKK